MIPQYRRLMAVASVFFCLAATSPGADIVEEGSAKNCARAVFEMGVQLGIVEQGASTGVDPATLVNHLKLAKRQAAKVGGVATVELDGLIQQMHKATDSRTVHRDIAQYRQRLSSQIASRLSLAQTKPLAALACTASSWVGDWDTTYGVMTLQLTKDGFLVGNYGTNQHSVSGKPSADDACLFVGEWKHTNSSSNGRFKFRMTKPGKFHGGWTSGAKDPATVGTNWTGTQRKKVARLR